MHTMDLALKYLDEKDHERVVTVTSMARDEDFPTLLEMFLVQKKIPTCMDWTILPCSVSMFLPPPNRAPSWGTFLRKCVV